MLGSGRSPGEEKGYPLQYFHLENSIDRGTWWERGYIAVVCVSLSFIVKIKMKMTTSPGFCDDQRKHVCGSI